MDAERRESLCSTRYNSTVLQSSLCLRTRTHRASRRWSCRTSRTRAACAIRAPSTWNGVFDEAMSGPCDLIFWFRVRFPSASRFCYAFAFMLYSIPLEQLYYSVSLLFRLNFNYLLPYRVS